jgi:hypothetical protein
MASTVQPTIQTQDTTSSLTSGDSRESIARTVSNQMCELIFDESGAINITNKKRRLIKATMDKTCGIPDCILHGYYPDDREIGTGDPDEEIVEISKIFEKCPSIAFSNLEKTIRKWIAEFTKTSSIQNEISWEKYDTFESDLSYDQEETGGYEEHKEGTPEHVYETETSTKPVYSSDPIKNIIIGGYKLFLQNVHDKKSKIKTRGVDLASEVSMYSRSSVYDLSIEEKIDQYCRELKEFLSDTFNPSFTWNDFKDSVIPVLDISGSMQGIPLEKGLFYMLVLVKLFGFTKLYYFGSDLRTKVIGDYTSNLDLIRTIYVGTHGSTNLESVFKKLNETPTDGKNIIIVTDSDCDPGHTVSNPFHGVISGVYPNITNCNFVVVNVKETTMKFPYLDIDPKVCYLSGNNPKTINGFIKAMCESVKTKTPITPTLILKHSLDLKELELPFKVPSYSKVMTKEKITKLHNAIKKNLPKTLDPSHTDI